MLFNDASLGGSTNEKSCNSCHPGGQGLEKSGDNVAKMVNQCIKGPLLGKSIDTESQEMKDLISYIISLKK